MGTEIGQQLLRDILRPVQDLTASHLLDEPAVKEYLAELVSRRMKKLDINGDRVLERLDFIGDVDPGEAMDDNNCWLPVKQMPIHVRKSIASIDIFEEWDFYDDPETGKRTKTQIGQTVRVKFCEKVRANELLGKNQKIFVDKLEINDVTNGKAERLAAARKRIVEAK